MKSINFILTVLFCFTFETLLGQTTKTDSLSFSEALSQVIQSFPSIQKVQYDLEVSSAKLALAKTANAPNVHLESSYTRIGPVSSIPFGGKDFQLFPANNYNASLNYAQTVYDFGKMDRTIAFEQQSKELTISSIEQIKQKLSTLLVGNFYSIVFLQEAIKIKQDEIATLNEHLHFVEKKVEAGSATRYEILTTKVRISSIENQKTDLLTALQVQQCQLNSFLGKPQESIVKVKLDLKPMLLLGSTDSLFNYALDHRNELKVARQKNALAQTRLNMVNALNNASVNVYASGGIKNGYIPDLNVLTPNFAVGLGIKVPLYDGDKIKHNRVQVVSEMRANDQETEIARRTIVNEVVESKANAEASMKKVSQSELQLEQAQQAYSLAETNFQAGVSTNLDLLDSYTAMSESKLVLLKTKIDYTVNLLKLKIALGEQIYGSVGM